MKLTALEKHFSSPSLADDRSRQQDRPHEAVKEKLPHRLLRLDDARLRALDAEAMSLPVVIARVVVFQAVSEQMLVRETHDRLAATAFTETMDSPLLDGRHFDSVRGGRLPRSSHFLAFRLTRANVT